MNAGHYDDFDWNFTNFKFMVHFDFQLFMTLGLTGTFMVLVHKKDENTSLDHLI